jgi:hypothetical protein
VSTPPSIKGSAFASLAEDAVKLLAAGRISRAETSRWLRPGDLEALDQPVVVARWYDIGLYARVTELMRDVDGDGSNEYVRARGKRSAQRLLQAGLYSQLEYLQRMESGSAAAGRARFEAFGRDLRKLTTMSASMFNFTRWASKPDPQRALRYVIEVTEAAAYPEVLCWSSEGFINEMSSQGGRGDAWRWRRPAPDLVVFEMTHPL